ncbi:Gfo/Idh/MocA family protein [Fimbriiglobus ruber]|uniref:Putative dehydrogenase n=1 Tax=Fimbriiglobus ruber TaxID=1908690 RepID=A0A225E6T9_9BACT|nr:Gfo/Idh/MocA family oxidoreductase [Fimbriiglobus ruber]OWK47474.1 putative dehydrogenase [Fimbriiglobus ruber]
MIKLGILDFDSSHSVEFTKRINHIGIAEEQWVDGAKVVVGCPGESKLSPERIPEYTAAMKKFGVPLVDKPEDMLGKVDAMLIEAVDGSVHWERAKPFLEAGVPCYVDKPFACSLDDARKLVDLSAKKKLPMFSSSSLRFAPEVVDYAADAKHGKLEGCVVYGPASLHERNPGLFHYGIHAAEILYTLMGPGCVRVTCTHEVGTDVATGQWKDGRVATVRGIRAGASGFGFVAFAEKGIKAQTIGMGVIYRELLKKVIETFKTGKPPIDPAETLEIVAFIAAAYKSANNHGAGESVKV